MTHHRPTPGGEDGRRATDPARSRGNLGMGVFNPLDAWAFAKLRAGQELNGELAGVTPEFQRIARHLAGLPLELRRAGWDGFLAARDDADDIIAALAAADPLGPAPASQTGRAFATAADVRRLMAETRWLWEGYIPTARVFGIAAFEGAGKTRFAMDLCRRVWHGLPWPDGQAATVAPGRPSLWVCSDGNQDELVEMLPPFGLPDEAVVFPAAPDDPYSGTDLDIHESLEAIETAIATVKPWGVFIDTLTSATSKDLCSQDVMKVLKTPLVRWVQTYGVIVGLLLHLSREGHPLGRRIKGITRTVIQLECPDPEDRPGRLRLWLPKTFSKRPPPLGVTMTDAGNEYDFDPPKAPERNPGGRPPEKREEARRFIVEALTRQNDRKTTELCDEWVKAGGKEGTFWNARKAMVEAGDLTCDGRPQIMHLRRPEGSETQDP
jgi:hypothetical protein